MEEIDNTSSIESKSNTKQNKLIKYVLASLAVLLGVGFIVAIVVVVVLHFSVPIQSENETFGTTTAGGRLKASYFIVADCFKLFDIKTTIFRFILTKFL